MKENSCDKIGSRQARRWVSRPGPRCHNDRLKSQSIGLTFEERFERGHRLSFLRQFSPRANGIIREILAAPRDILSCVDDIKFFQKERAWLLDSLPPCHQCLILCLSLIGTLAYIIHDDLHLLSVIVALSKVAVQSYIKLRSTKIKKAAQTQKLHQRLTMEKSQERRGAGGRI